MPAWALIYPSKIVHSFQDLIRPQSNYYEGSLPIKPNQTTNTSVATSYCLQRFQITFTKLLLVLFSSNTWPWSRSWNQITSNPSSFLPRSIKSVVTRAHLSKPSRYARIVFVSITQSLPAKTTVAGRSWISSFHNTLSAQKKRRNSV